MIGDHKLGVLQFSGGKDSTVLLHKAIPFRDKLFVVWADSGMAFPHVERHVRETAAAWGFQLAVVAPQTSAMLWTMQHGLPADLASAWRHPNWSWVSKQPVGQKLVTPMDCCSRNLWQPMWQFTKEVGATVMLRGARLAEVHRGASPGSVVEGIELSSPLWDWSDEEIDAYIKQHEIKLPDHYALVNESLDCWGCTAHLNLPSSADRLRYTRDFHPDKWPTLSRRLKRVEQAVVSDFTTFMSVMKETDNAH